MRFVKADRAVVVAVLLLSAVLPARAQDRVIGLLTLPEVFSPECAPFTPRPVTIYDQPRGAPIGTLEAVALPPTPSGAGCFEVTVHRGQSRRELPNREYAYIDPAAIVIGQRDGWFKIRLSDGAAWVAPSPEHEFHDLGRLFKAQEFQGTTAGFSGRLSREPSGATFGELLKEHEPVAVREVRLVGGREWLRVDVLSHSPCDANINIEPRAIATGWLAAHDAAGEPTVWFYSRGC